jgi:hypothetical protein
VLGSTGESGVLYSYVAFDGNSVYSLNGIVSLDENTYKKALATMRRIMNSIVIAPTNAIEY